MLGLGFSQLDKVLSALQAPALRVHPVYCSRLRHRLSKCTLCSEYCPTKAIEWTDSLQVDPDQCTSCGICATVCPTGVFEAQAPTNMQLLNRIKESKKERDSVAFACPRYLEAGGGDVDQVIQVNCLGRLDESILVGAVSEGIKAVWLIDGACQECLHVVGRAVAEQSLQRANVLLQAFGVQQRIFIGPQVPSGPSAAARPPAATEGLSRRAFFRLATRQAARTAVVAADSILSSPAAQAEEDQRPKKGEQPVHLPAKRRLLLEALKRVGEPSIADFEPDGGPWAQFGFTETCTGCQMCAFFCPTGALSKIEEDGKAGVAFRISHCTNCRLCQEICYQEAIVLSSAVDLSEILDDTIDVLLMREVEATPWLASPEERIKRLLETTF